MATAEVEPAVVNTDVKECLKETSECAKAHEVHHENGNHNGSVNGNSNGTANGTANGSTNGDVAKADTVADSSPAEAVKQNGAANGTTETAVVEKEAPAAAAETKAIEEPVKADNAASSSPPQKSRTNVETAKIGQALLAAEAPMSEETRKQPSEKTEEKSEEVAAEQPSPAKKGPGRGRKSAAKEPAKEATKEPVKESPKPDNKEAAKDSEEPSKAATPRKRGGRPSLVDQLVQEAQKFAGNAAGDVSEGRVTRRASKGPEVASPAKRSRPSKGKKAANDDEDSDD